MFERLGAVMQSHIDDGMALLDTAQSRFERRDVVVELDMAYVGQTHTVSVALPVQMDASTVSAPAIGHRRPWWFRPARLASVCLRV